MSDCMQCIHCRTTLPIKYPRAIREKIRRGELLTLRQVTLGMILYGQKMEIWCDKGMWIDTEGRQKVYHTTLYNFAKARINFKNPNCPEFET